MHQRDAVPHRQYHFSALQRAENSSIKRVAQHLAALRAEISVLFSEPKIPQSATRETSSAGDGAISVLFSEPKIPQ